MFRNVLKVSSVLLINCLLASLNPLSSSASSETDSQNIELQSSNYFIQGKFLPLLDEQYNDGALAKIDEKTVLIFRRQGEIYRYNPATHTMSPELVKIPYFPIKSPRYIGERGLAGVKGALYIAKQNTIFVSTVEVTSDCAYPVLYRIPLNDLGKLGSPRAWLKSPNCARVPELSSAFPAITALNRQGQPNISQAGGRLVEFQSAVLWSVGNFGDSWKTLEQTLASAYDRNDFFGKVIRVPINAPSNYSTFTSGHRNPQGLLVDSSQQIWSTEHGAEGGDELNQLSKGGKYGWPFVSLGHDYSDSSGRYKSSSSHLPIVSYGKDGFLSPKFAWVPSIAPSQLTYVPSNSSLKSWRGDFILGTLKDTSIRRLVLVRNRVVADERIPIGYRVRDLVIIGNKIIILTDSNGILCLTLKSRQTPE